MRALNEALIIVDVQNDFCPQGALAVSGGDKIIPAINRLMAEFQTVVLTQDWHPADHQSFADMHADAAPFSVIPMPYGPQVLWPRHCVQGTKGAEFHPDLWHDRAHLIVRKGFRVAVDSYSAFFENDQKTQTGLEGFLKNLQVNRLTFAGLATDFCVAYSALDAVRLGFEVTLNAGLCRAIDLNGSLAEAKAKCLSAGVVWQD